MQLNERFPPVYPILDASFLSARKDRADFLGRLVFDLAQAGVGILQYRNKQGDKAEILADARVMSQAAGSKQLLILNDWPELAVAAGFDGVHVGQTDMSPALARGIVGPGKLVGVSTHNPTQLRTADAEPVDYIAFGPVFATSTKVNPDPEVGLEGVRLARALTRKPLVAIGGISLENAVEVKRAGADSVAMISAIFSPACDPAKSAGDFLALLR